MEQMRSKLMCIFLVHPHQPKLIRVASIHIPVNAIENNTTHSPIDDSLSILCADYQIILGLILLIDHFEIGAFLSDFT